MINTMKDKYNLLKVNNMTTTHVMIFALVILFALPLVHAQSTNVTYNYVYNGTSWIPWLATADGRPKVDINLFNVTAGSMAVNTNTLYVNGNSVGIGTTSPATLLHLYTSASRANLRLDSAGAGGNLRWAVNGSDLWQLYSFTGGELRLDAASNVMTWNGTSGNVGIGTTSPGALLAVKGSSDLLNLSNSSGTQILLAGSTGYVTVGSANPWNKKFSVYDENQSSNIVYMAVFLRQRIAGGGNDGLFIGNDGGGAGGTTKLVSSGTNSQSMGLGPSGAELFINATTNNVGIGTTSPSEKLDINAGRIALRTGVTGSWDNPNVYMRLGVDSSIGFIQLPRDNRIGILNSSGNEKVSFLENGNVGIGTTAPGGKLDVNGTLKVGGFYTKVYTLNDGTVNGATIDLITGDNNNMYEVIYTSQHYDQGTGTAGWRYVRWHGYDGSGGGAEGAGDNFNMTVVETSGTGESSHTPTWSTVGGNYRLTYGSGYMTYRQVVINVYAGYAPVLA